jgi:branched-chain amino acid transport system substrate-binding protein
MRRFVVIGLLAALVWTLALPAFAAPSRSNDGHSSAQDLRRAVELYEAGQREEALSRFRGFVVRHSASPLLPEAYLYLARIFRDSGHYHEALLYIDRIPSERKGKEARLIEGASLIGAAQTTRGVEILQGLEGADLARADHRLRFSALAEGNIQMQRHLPALFFIHRALTVSGPREAEDLLQRGHLLLRDRLDDSELAEAAFMFAGAPLGQDALLQQALRAFARGDRHAAQTLARRVVQSPVPFPYRRDALLLFERLTGQGTPERTVAVMLPLSGRYGAFGTLVRRGMELALQVHSDSAVQFEFVDIEADPERSARAVSDASIKPSVLAMVGPLTGGSAVSAAAQAQRERVPLLSLSQRSGIPETGDYVFRFSLTASEQIRALVRYAVEERGITTFAMLVPENRLGEEMAELFVREVQKRGAVIVARQSYPEVATDFKAQVRRLMGRSPEQPDPPLAERTPPPFEALFIPDFSDRISLVAPQVAFYGITGVQLLGINGWNSPELTRLAGSFVEGAVFVDGFFKGSLNPVVREFVHLYKQKYGEEPTVLESQGFDAANILLTLLSNPAVRTREDVRQALARLQGFPSISGPTSFDEHGEALRELFMLQIRRGAIEQIN